MAAVDCGGSGRWESRRSRVRWARSGPALGRLLPGHQGAPTAGGTHRRGHPPRGAPTSGTGPPAPTYKVWRTATCLSVGRRSRCPLMTRPSRREPPVLDPADLAEIVGLRFPKLPDQRSIRLISLWGTPYAAASWRPPSGGHRRTEGRRPVRRAAAPSRGPRPERARTRHHTKYGGPQQPCRRDDDPGGMTTPGARMTTPGRDGDPGSRGTTGVGVRERRGQPPPTSSPGRRPRPAPGR